MFILSKLADTIQIIPEDFTKRSRDALEDNINSKYSNKVIPRVGLVICFYDLLSTSEGLIGHGDGTVNVNVTFRLLVFRPFKGEVIEGVVGDSSPNCIKIHLEFFSDITIPAPTLIFDRSQFDTTEQTWVWTPDGASGKFWFDKNERVRLRVEGETWTDVPPVRPSGASDFAAALGGDNEEERERKGARVAWSLSASMNQGGLGILSWWDDDE